MRLDDLAWVAAIQAGAYAVDLLEDDATLRARFSGFPDTAWVAEGPSGVCAYLVAYRSVLDKVSPLGGHFESPTHANCLYLHDLAIDARATGQQLGSLLVRQALLAAEKQGLAYSALVSVQNSQAFWQRLGYRPRMLVARQQQLQLATYSGHGVYMAQALGRELAL